MRIHLPTVAQINLAVRKEGLLNANFNHAALFLFLGENPGDRVSHASDYFEVTRAKINSHFYALSKNRNLIHRQAKVRNAPMNLTVRGHRIYKAVNELKAKQTVAYSPAMYNTIQALMDAGMFRSTFEIASFIHIVGAHPEITAMEAAQIYDIDYGQAYGRLAGISSRYKLIERIHRPKEPVMWALTPTGDAFYRKSLGKSNNRRIASA